MTGVGSSPALATCETSHVLLAGVSSEVENIFISLVAKEQMKQMKYTCFSLHEFPLMHVRMITVNLTPHLSLWKIKGTN